MSSVHLFIYPFVHMSFCPSVCPSASWFVCPSELTDTFGLRYPCSWTKNIFWAPAETIHHRPQVLYIFGILGSWPPPFYIQITIWSECSSDLKHWQWGFSLCEIFFFRWTNFFKLGWLFEARLIILSHWLFLSGWFFLAGLISLSPAIFSYVLIFH